MIKHSIIISSLMFLSLIANTAQAQNTDYPVREISTIATDIFSFIKNLNSDIDSFFVKEKAQQLKRELRYFKNDLSRYLVSRKSLLDYLEENDYQDLSHHHLDKVVLSLQKEISKIVIRMKQLTPYVSSNLSSDEEEIISRIAPSYSSQKKYLTELEKFIDGKGDKAMLRKEGNEIYKDLVATVDLVTVIQSKLDFKYKL